MRFFFFFFFVFQATQSECACCMFGRVIFFLAYLSAVCGRNFKSIYYLTGPQNPIVTIHLHPFSFVMCFFSSPQKLYIACVTRNKMNYKYSIRAIVLYEYSLANTPI